MKVAIINTSRKGVEVHAAGCADVAKSEKRNREDAWILDVDSRVELSHTYWHDQIGDTVDPDSAEGWTIAEDWMVEFNFLPCCGDLPYSKETNNVNHTFTSDSSRGKCTVCGKTRNVKAHRTPEPETTVRLWVGWRIAEAAMADDTTLAGKLRDTKPNSVRDRFVDLTPTELRTLDSVATTFQAKGNSGPVVYSATTLRRRIAEALS